MPWWPGAALPLLLAAGALGLPAPVVAQPATAWAAATHPSAGPPRILGAHGLGCIGGAVAMPADGPGWQLVRLSRNRFWGHPDLIATLRSLAAQAREAGLPPLWIGDLGQPRGGPMPWGHSSHQSGLDADVWLDLRPKSATPPAAREAIAVPSVVRPDGLAVDPARFTPGHATLIRLAASQAGVERIFVHPAIKRALCVASPGAPWLRRVRPWRGHDSHIHIRLRCPQGQPECQSQASVAAGDGCGAELEWWFTPEAREPTPPTDPAPGRGTSPPRLPAACGPLLGEP